MKQSEKNAEFAGVGKDWCNKINKDSATECREALKNVDEKAFDGYWLLCLKPNQTKDGQKTVLSAHFVVLSPQKIRFKQFTPAYKEYLKNKNDTDRLSRVESIKPGIYSTESIPRIFGFMKENNCRHCIQSHS